MQPNMRHTSPTRHLKGEPGDDLRGSIWGTVCGTETQPILTSTKFFGPSTGHSETTFRSSVMKVVDVIVLQTSHIVLKIETPWLCRLTPKKYTVGSCQHHGLPVDVHLTSLHPRFLFFQGVFCQSGLELRSSEPITSGLVTGVQFPNAFSDPLHRGPNFFLFHFLKKQKGVLGVHTEVHWASKSKGQP
jgi:hypothetical protein